MKVLSVKILFVLLVVGLGFSAAAQDLPGIERANSAVADTQRIETNQLMETFRGRYRKILTKKGVEYRTYCKNYLIISSEDTTITDTPNLGVSAVKEFQLSGNVLYDFNYRSLIDTPFAQTNFQQHFLQANLNLLLFEKYPIQVRLTSRQSNSPFFKNYTDVAVLYSRADYLPIVKQKLLRALDKEFKDQMLFVEQLNQTVLEETHTVQQLETFLSDRDQWQHVVEAKELLSGQELEQTKQLQAFSSKARWERGVILPDRPSPALSQFGSKQEAEHFLQQFEEKLKLKDSLRKKLERLKTKLEEATIFVTKQIRPLQQEIYSLRSLEDIRGSQGLGHLLSSVPKVDRHLLALRTFGIGKSFVDYSELTARNISLSGINLEFNAKYYYAFALGSLDYRFRDFNLKNTVDPKQYMALLRIGKGDVQRSHFIITAYKGRKNNFNFNNPLLSQQSIYGASVEQKLLIGNHHAITAELAKSASNTGNSKPAFQFSDRTTFAWSVKLNSNFQVLHTQVAAAYRFMGANFQSFGLYRPTANQTSWSVSIRQSLFHQSLVVQGSLRQNETTNPYVPLTYNSHLLFKSLFVSFRRKHLPYISLGYLPTSQLTKINERVFENQFHTITGTASHFYRLFSMQASTMMLFSQNKNNSADSGQLYFNARNLTLSQALTGKSFGFSLAYSVSQSALYDLRVLTNGLTINNRRGVGIGMGYKINQLNRERLKYSYYGNATIPVDRTSSFSLSYETSFLPSLEKTLSPYQMGHLSYFKQF